MVADAPVEGMQSQQQWRTVLAMTTLMLCCLATAPCGYLLLKLRKMQLSGNTYFCTNAIIALDMAQCWLLLCFTIPTQLKGMWLFGHPACLLQAFATRVLRGGAHLALIILALQGCRCRVQESRLSQLDQHTRLFFFFSWIIISSVSVFPFVVSDASYTFYKSFSHCEVCKKYFVIHDVITFCLPAVLLIGLSVGLFVCMCHRPQTRNADQNSGSTSPAEDQTDDALTQSTANEVTRMTSQHDVPGAAPRCSSRRSLLEIKSTMTICTLCTESAILMTVELLFRLWGMLTSDPTFLACSVLYACAGHVVRSTSIVIIERTYRGSPFFTTLTSLLVTGDDPMSRRQFIPRTHSLSFHELNRNRARRQRQEKKPSKPCGLPISDHTIDDHIVGTSATSKKRSPSKTSAGSDASRVTEMTSVSLDRYNRRDSSGGFMANVNQFSVPSCVITQRSRRRSSAYQSRSPSGFKAPWKVHEISDGGSYSQRVAADVSTDSHNQMQALVAASASRDDHHVDTSSSPDYFLPFLPEKKEAAENTPRRGYMNVHTSPNKTRKKDQGKLSPRRFWLSRINLRRHHGGSPDERGAQGSDSTTRKRSPRNISMADRVAFIRKRLHDLGVSGSRATGDEVDLHGLDRHKQPMPSRARLFTSNHRSRPGPRKKYGTAQMGAEASGKSRNQAAGQLFAGQTPKVARHETEESGPKGKKKERQTEKDRKKDSLRMPGFLRHRSLPEAFSAYATEDSQWDGSPETLSSVWLNSPCLKSGRIHTHSNV